MCSAGGHWFDSRLDADISFSHARVMLINSSFTKRFHVAVRLFSNRSQMTSKCG